MTHKINKYTRIVLGVGTPASQKHFQVEIYQNTVDLSYQANDFLDKNTI